MNIETFTFLAGDQHDALSGACTLNNWCSWKLAAADNITFARDFNHICLAFGTPKACAILAEWRAGKLDNLDGNYGAVIADIRTRTVSIVSDLIGHRALRFWTDGPTIAVSPHDLSLVSAGLFSASLLPERVAELAVHEHVLGGASLIQGIEATSGGEIVQWQADRIARTAPTFFANRRTAKPRDIVDKMISRARECVADTLKLTSHVSIDLTAGQDSRASLALVLAECDAANVTTFTTGHPDSIDARVARHIARQVNVPHEIAQPEPASINEFISNTKRLAFGMNGATDAKRAVLKQGRRDSGVRASGMGGEVFRGYYYRNGKTARQVLEESCEHRISAIGLLPCYASAVRHSHRTAIDRYNLVAETDHDLLDLYYLRERFGVWGALRSRTYLGPNDFYPLVTPSLVRLGYSLPQPIGDNADFSRECVRRLLPAVYWTRVNDRVLMPLIRYPRLQRLNTACLRVRDAIWSRPAGASTEDARTALFAGEMMGYLMETLTAPGTVAVEIFGRKGVEALLTDHKTGRRNHLKTIGGMLTAEHFRLAVMDTAHEAAKFRRTKEACSTRIT